MKEAKCKLARVKFNKYLKNYKMALKRLPLEIQSKFYASTKIKTFKSAVEQLVYNAFDAESKSITIRVHIQENYVQVVDNGHGVSKNDINLLGQRHTTSRYENPPTSRTIQKYGRTGQSLANIIEISESVKITSRCSNTEETWVKHFVKGKAQKCFLTATRPSVGTTVEIKGFLYNLTIQKKAVKPLQELQAIKTFLEQISLVHCNTSISLRDNTENEIIFKIHKNRDIYQTLSLLLGLEKSKLQELQVEKNQYKVTGFFQKKDAESLGYQWIYVNGTLINNSNLHHMVNQNLLKSGMTVKKLKKTKGQKDKEEKVIGNNKLPDYFIFIKCPDFENYLISNEKLSILEFKKVTQVDTLLEKLVKFYTGDIKVEKKVIGNVPVDTVNNDITKKSDTRNQVKQIMEKILCSRQKRIIGSHLHNGVKGKNMKRKPKEKDTTASKSKPNNECNNIKRTEVHELTDVLEQNHEELLNNGDNNAKAPAYKIVKKKKRSHETLGPNIKQQKLGKLSNHIKTKKEPVMKDPVISKFEKETDTVQKRCHILANKVHGLLGFKKKRKCKIFTNEMVQYSNIFSDKKSISICRKIEEEIIHEYLPLPRKVKALVHPNHNKNDNNVLKSDDLIHPVIITESERNVKLVKLNEIGAEPRKSVLELDNIRINSKLDLTIPKLTYESHDYLKQTQVRPDENFIRNNIQFQFISKKSRDYFASQNKTKASRKRPIKTHPINKLFESKKTKDMFTDLFESSYSIHFTETADNEFYKTPSISPNVSDIVRLSDATRIGSTYTIIDSGKATNHDAIIVMNNATDLLNNATDVIIKGSTPDISERIEIEVPKSNTLFSDQPNLQDSLMGHRNVTIEEGNNFNVIFISDSEKLDMESKINHDIEPLQICETVLHCDDGQDNEEYNFIFNSINNVVEESVHNETCMEVCETMFHNDGNIVQEGNTICNGGGEEMHNQTELERDFDINNFNLKNRHRFVPKGMSQIFENCNSRNVCNYQFDKDYFDEIVYQNFVQDVQVNSEIFEPRIRNVKETATKDIEKVNNKLNKNNACLIFNGNSLKQAKVLGQVDSKFIATTIRGITNIPHNYLVLFDQHAVHERIRLENNMAEYFYDGIWKSVTLDGISLKLSNDEILYLHNYKDKFYKLGLKWNILSNVEVLIKEIPAAVLGKNPRQEDIVLKAVKSLIKEEINIIKEQGGCVSLYPKSIMDLVFSEACRYAIMFGDALSRTECAGLINVLSDCKTPFQCAHGRPVMAVLMDIKTEKHLYKVNDTKVQQFVRRMQNKSK